MTHAITRAITGADLLPPEVYGRDRAAHRARAVALKRNRRVEVGPFATFHFENRETMWHQIHEMLFIERGGEEQVADELAAYNPLVPQGRELVATIMFEIDEPARRKAVLGRLGGIEDTVWLRVGDDVIAAVPEADIDRTTAAGKASAVQFVHFPFTDGQIAAFRAAAAGVVLGFGHDAYAHAAAMPEAVREVLAGDFD